MSAMESNRTAPFDRSTVQLVVNGISHRVEVSLEATLLKVLRESFDLTGSKEACGRGECGACTVLMGGRPVVSCLLLAGVVEAPITTIEGLVDELRDVREAFADLGGFQCGYCTSGLLVHTAAILREGLPREAARAERLIRLRLSGNICRCTGYTGIVHAIMKAAALRNTIAHEDAEK